jgi:rhodanese-related sulfurtransferase
MNPAGAVPQVPAAQVPQGAVLIDVREDDEWQAGHAPDAQHIPMGEVSARSAEIPHDGEVYVICRSGARSARVAQALAGGGWTVRNVSDGMHGWDAAGRTMVTDSGAPPFVA